MGGYAFISYSRADRAYVEKLALHLNALGIPTWYDYRLVAGEVFDYEIERQIENCAAFLVILSPQSTNSTWVGREITYADGLHKPLLPLLLEPVDRVPIRLAGLHQENVVGSKLPSIEFINHVRTLVGLIPDEPAAPPLGNPIEPDARRAPTTHPHSARQVSASDDIQPQQVGPNSPSPSQAPSTDSATTADAPHPNPSSLSVAGGPTRMDPMPRRPARSVTAPGRAAPSRSLRPPWVARRARSSRLSGRLSAIGWLGVVLILVGVGAGAYPMLQWSPIAMGIYLAVTIPAMPVALFSDERHELSDLALLTVNISAFVVSTTTIVICWPMVSWTSGVADPGFWPIMLCGLACLGGVLGGTNIALDDAE